MLGSALPAALLLIALNFLHPAQLLLPIALLGLLAARLAGAPMYLLLAGICAVAGSAVPFRYSEYKTLPQTLLLPEARILAEYPSPGALVHTVASPHSRWMPSQKKGTDLFSPRR